MKKLIKFLIAGVPAFLVAIPLNYFLVTKAGLSKPVAYAIVLVVQVTINFFACRYYVFDAKPGRSLWQSFGAFLGGILLFRLADWGVYVLLTTRLDFHYLAVQFFNVALFGLLKFQFSKLVFEWERKPTRR